MIEIVEVKDHVKQCLHCKAKMEEKRLYSLNIHYSRSGQETILCYKCLFCIATMIINQVLEDIIGVGMKELNERIRQYEV